MNYDTFCNNLINIPNINASPLHYVFDNKLVKNDSSLLYLEVGVFSGNTINYIASKIPHTVYGFDSFEGLPEKWDRNDMDFPAGTFNVNGNLPHVRNNVTLIKGWFSNTLAPFINQNNKSIAFIHIDCDIYSSTKDTFDALGKNIMTGAVIVFDELVNYEGYTRNGELRAFYEWIIANNIEFEWIGMNGKLNDVGCEQEKVAVIIKNNPLFNL